VIDASALHMVLAVLTGWLDRRERQAIGYLMEENASFDAGWVSSGSNLLMPTGDAWRSVGTGWAARSYFRSPRS
jgi:hypothetical protein